MAKDNKNKDTFDFIARRREKRKFEEFMKGLRKEETPIEKYCRLIRNRPAFFEMTFEEYEEAWDERKRMLKKEQADNHAFNKFFSEKPKGMSKAEWIKQKHRMKKNRREQEKQLRLDRSLEFKMTPIRLFEDQMDKIGCECQAEGIRQGQFCDTCRLITKVNSYMMKLFKDFAEGDNSLLVFMKGKRMAQVIDGRKMSVGEILGGAAQDSNGVQLKFEQVRDHTRDVCHHHLK